MIRIQDKIWQEDRIRIWSEGRIGYERKAE
jgi:hypothetical protein